MPDENWRTLSWRRGTKGDLQADFATLLVRVAYGPVISRNRRLRGEDVWLLCERRVSGERKRSPSNHAEDVSLGDLAALIKGGWVCEQAHQQMKEELGLDHFEGRSWRGLHHRALMTMIAFAVLQHLRAGAKPRPAPVRRHAPPATGQPPARGHPERLRAALSSRPPARALPPLAMKLAK